MDTIAKFLSGLQLKSDFDTLFKKEESFLYELGGFRKFKKHTLFPFDYIRSYHFTQMVIQEPWICLNLFIKNEYNLNVLELINNLLRDNLQSEIAAHDFNNQNNLNSLIKTIYIGKFYQLQIELEKKDLSIEIIKYQ